jgi:hypothetical protein
MKLRLILGVLGDRVRVGPDHENHLPSEELRLYVGQSGVLMALSPKQVELLTAPNGNGNGNGETKPAERVTPNAQLPEGYQQAPEQ